MATHSQGDARATRASVQQREAKKNKTHIVLSIACLVIDISLLAGLYYLFMPTDAIVNDAFQGIVENIVLEFFGIPDIGAIVLAILAIHFAREAYDGSGIISRPCPIKNLPRTKQRSSPPATLKSGT